MNKAILGVMSLIGCAEPQYATIDADYAVRVREASPNQNYVGQPGVVGCSADGFDRYVVHFPLDEVRGKNITYATLHFDTTQV